MALFMRPRRPLMRLAAGAATAGVAYQAGTRRSQQEAISAPAQAAYDATQGAPAAPPPAAATGTTAELERLAELHKSGALSDAEFAAAKSRLLGI
jgi:hypothetical protein